VKEVPNLIPAAADEESIMTTRKAQDEAIPVDALEESNSDSDQVIDFSGVTELSEIPPDDYLCMVKSFTYGMSRRQIPTYTVNYTIQEPEEFAGRNLRDYLSLKEDALFSLYHTLRALGEDPDAMKAEGKFKVVPDNYVGRSIVVQTQSEEYPPESGTMRAKVYRTKSADLWDQISSF
jgi:hypothetical protein